jgi:hypothetical protein
MFCGLKEFLKPHRPEVYALFKQACLEGILLAPCTLIIPSKDVLKTIEAKIQSADAYQDGVDILKGYILATPIHDLDSTTGSFRTKMGTELSVENGTIHGSKVHKVDKFSPRQTIPRSSGEMVGKHALYELKGAEAKMLTSYPEESYSMSSSHKMTTKRGKRVPKKKKTRGGADDPASMVAGMFLKHSQIMHRGAKQCSPFSEAMGYLLSLVLNSKKDEIIGAVRLVASYDPAVFYLGLNLGSGSASVIPSEMLSNWNPAKRIDGDLYGKILAKFLAEGERALEKKGVAFAGLVDRVESNRMSISAKPETLSSRYDAFGNSMSGKGIPLTSAQKRFADSVYWRATNEGGYLSILATLDKPVESNAFELFGEEAFIHLIHSDRDHKVNTAFEKNAFDALERQTCDGVPDDDPVIRYARELVERARQ